MHDRQTDRHILMERFLIVLIIGFVFAFGFALYQLDAAAKEISSGLAGFAPIGSWPF
jgi:hypothetical protein